MTVVFTDSFTVGSDTDIDAYPSGSADYAYNDGSGSQFLVDAANDYAMVTVNTTHVKARIIDSAVSGVTGDQEVTVNARASSGWSSGEACVRMATSGTLTNYYTIKIETPETNECRIYRVDNGTFTLLASADRSLTTGVHELRLKATGTNPVALEAQFGGTTVLTYDDSSASRKTSGAPGIGAWRFDVAAAPIYVDDVSVDDLASGGPTPVSLAGSMPVFTGGLQIKQPQAVAGSFPEQVGVITRQLSLARAVAGSVPEQVGTLQIKQPQLVEGALPAPTGDVVALSAKTVAGSLAAPTGDVVALYAKRNLSGVMPEFVGVVSPRQSLFRALTGTFPEMTGDVSAFAAAVQLAGIFPEMTGALARQLSLFRALTATMPVFTGTVTPVVVGGVNVAGSMPAQSGALTLFWDESGSEGPNSGGSAENVDNSGVPGSLVWADPSNALADDGAVARALSANIISDYLRIYNFGFSIPSGATITGIEVTIQAAEQAGASTLENLQLIADDLDNRTLIGTDKNPQQALTTTLTDYTFGGSSDLWGASLTPAIVNHSNFGFSVTSKNNAGVYTYIDYVSMTVYYSVRAGKLVGAFGPQAGDVTAIETIVLAGSMPEQTGALSLLGRIAVGGTMPEMVGAVDVRQFAALTGLMPEQSGVLSLLAHIALSGSMPEQVGLILSDLGVFVAGSMPEQSGALSLLARIALSGSMPEQSGVLAIIAAKILAGEMPEFTGDVAIDRLLSHIALTGEMGDFLGTLVVPTSPGWMRPKGGGSLYIPRPKGGGSIYQPRPRGGFGFHQPRP